MNVWMEAIVLQWCSVAHVVSSYASIVTTITKRSRHLSKHNMVGLDQEGARQLHTTMKPRDHSCSQPNHEDNKLNFYCETCSLPVCLHCSTVTHKSHSVKEISTVAKTHQMEITGALEDAKEVVTKLT